MKSTNAFISLALSLARARWLQPALCALVLIALVLGASGCSSPHH